MSDFRGHFEVMPAPQFFHLSNFPFDSSFSSILRFRSYCFEYLVLVIHIIVKTGPGFVVKWFANSNKKQSIDQFYSKFRLAFNLSQPFEFQSFIHRGISFGRPFEARSKPLKIYLLGL